MKQHQSRLSAKDSLHQQVVSALSEMPINISCSQSPY